MKTGALTDTQREYAHEQLTALADSMRYFESLTPPQLIEAVGTWGEREDAAWLTAQLGTLAMALKPELPRRTKPRPIIWTPELRAAMRKQLE